MVLLSQLLSVLEVYRVQVLHHVLLLLVVLGAAVLEDCHRVLDVVVLAVVLLMSPVHMADQLFIGQLPRAEEEEEVLQAIVPE
jgi:hypothetical protein